MCFQGRGLQSVVKTAQQGTIVNQKEMDQTPQCLDKLLAHQCDICGKYVPSHMARHKLSHSAIKAQQCHICQRSFKHKAHLNRHLTYKHMVVNTSQHSTIHDQPELEGQTHQCLDKLLRHQCDICGKFVPNHLERHKLSHSAIKAHQCHICQRSFKQKAALNRHITFKHMNG